MIKNPGTSSQQSRLPFFSKLHRMGWMGGSVELFAFNTANGFRDYAANYETQHAAIIILQGSAETEQRILNNKSSPVALRKPGDIVFFRTGSMLKGRVYGNLKYLCLSIEPSFVETSLEIKPEGVLLAPTYNGRMDSTSFALAQDLAINLKHSSSPDSLLINSATTLITLKLIHAVSKRGHSDTTYGSLSGWRLRLILDFIDSSMHKNISLSDMAECANLSLPHFARAFQHATGIPPHQFLNQRRIERSFCLLRNEDLSLSDVALSLGFNSQSHFTTVFRKQVGITPARYRQESH